MEIARAKGLRGSIVMTLYTVYPQPVTAATLKSMLRYKGLNSESDIQKAIFYLNGKKYIQIEEAAGYWDGKITLTPTGVNLAEADASDVGVVIDE